jgi:hypothetical protein
MLKKNLRELIRKLKKKYSIFIFFVIICCTIPIQISAQELDDHRKCNWSQSGLSYDIPRGEEYDITDFGADEEGNIPSDSSLAEILELIGDLGGTVYFPPGEYLFTKPIRLSSGISLQGHPFVRPILNFDLESESSCVIASGRKLKDTILLTGDVERGDSYLRYGGGLPPESRVFHYLIDDDVDKISSDWAKFSTGQIVVFHQISKDFAHTEDEIRRDYLAENNAKLVVLEMVKDITISNLVIHNQTATDRQTSNFELSYAHNFLIKCVESYNSNFAHVELNFCRNVEISGSFFKDAHAYGGGGQGYGVVLQYATGDCLVYDNVFEHLRHSILLQAGANGNVISYNYSMDPHWTETSLPADAAGDLVCHGNYPYLNLFESNIVQNIVIDDSHGENGPYNTFFRNRAENYGIFMNPGIPSDSQNFIGNEVTSSGLLKGLYFLSGKEHFEYGNNVKGKTTPASTENIDLVSYYSGEYITGMPWIGYPNELDSQDIPAKVRYSKDLLTYCDDDETYVDRVINNTYPQVINYQQFKELVENQVISNIAIYDYCGQLIRTDVENPNLAKGIYFIVLSLGDQYILIP